MRNVEGRAFNLAMADYKDGTSYPKGLVVIVKYPASSWRFLGMRFTAKGARNLREKNRAKYPNTLRQGQLYKIVRAETWFRYLRATGRQI